MALDRSIILLAAVVCGKNARTKAAVRTIAAIQEEVPAMYQDQKNEYGCPLHHQSGSMAVRDFDAIVERLPPELRAAFEAERAARWIEHDALFHATYAPLSAAPTADAGTRAPELAKQNTWKDQLWQKIGQLANCLPQKVASFGM